MDIKNRSQASDITKAFSPSDCVLPQRLRGVFLSDSSEFILGSPVRLSLSENLSISISDQFCGSSSLPVEREREMEEKNKRNCRTSSSGPGSFLQWGKRKRLRCLRAKDRQISHEPNSVLHKRIASRFLDKETFLLQPSRFFRGPEAGILRSGVPAMASLSDNERCYPTRGSVDNNGKVCSDGMNGEDNKRGKGSVWPKLFVTLSSKEKEEDFMAMKGCKPPQRPKKRAKFIQRSLLLVSPGAWLGDLCPDRYDVREKKSSKKRARGLKAMGNLETDSE